MATNSNALVMRFEADTRKLERELRRLQRINDRAANRMASAHRDAANQTSQAWRQVSGQIKQYAGVIAAAFSTREIIAATDSYQRFTNQLTVTGLEGQKLKTVQKDLFAIAQKNGVAIEGLGELYGNAAQVSSDLGASQSQLTDLTNASANSLRITGKSAAQAQGALLGLSQALASGTVKAEEYNQMNEGGLRPLLQAIAQTEKYGGSLGKLRNAVVEGELSSREFFQLILQGSAELEEKATRANLTVAQSFTILSNSFTKYIGEASSASGASALLTGAIIALAENLPTIIDAVLVLAGVYAATFIPAVVRSTQALIANATAMATTGAVYSAQSGRILAGATAMNTVGIAGRGLLGVLGGPLGLAITGIAAGLAYFSVKAAEAEAETRALTAAADAAEAEFGGLATATATASKETKEASNQQLIAKAAALGLKIETEKLADARYADAAATRVQTLEQLKLNRARAAEQYLADFRAAKHQAGLNTGGRAAASRRDGFSGGTGLGDRQNEIMRDLMEGQSYKNFVKLDANYKAAKDAPLEVVDVPSVAGTVSGTNRKNTKGRSASDGADQIAQLAREALQLQIDSTTDLEERHRLQKELLALDMSERENAIQSDLTEGKLTEAAALELQTKQSQVKALKEAALNETQQAEIEARNVDLAKERNALLADQLDSEASNLEDQARRSRNVEQRYDLLWQALDKRQQAEKLDFDLSQKQYALDLQKLNLTKEEIDNMLAKRAKIFGDGQARDAGALSNREQQDTASVTDRIGEYADSFGTLNEQLSAIATGAIDNLTRGLADAALGAKSLGDAFGEMAEGIIANLIEMAARFVIFEAIGMAFGVKGLGKAAIGLGGQKSGTVSTNQAGTDFFGGGLTTVGENGPELVALPRGSQVGPNNLLRSVMQGAARLPSHNGMSGGIVIQTTVNAQDAVLTGQVKNWIAEGNAQAVASAQKVTLDRLGKRQRNNLIR